MVNSSADSTLGAGVGSAHRPAGLADVIAGLIRPTVRVCPTLHIDTSNQGIALESDSADTASLVEVHLALRTTAARSICV